MIVANEDTRTGNWCEIVATDGEDFFKVLSVVKDAQSFGFEFKVENHKVYCREAF